MNAVATPQPYEVPEGGLASFLTATVGDWSDEALNSDTYYDIVKPTAEQLAEFGREEDDRIAHVATGETVVPMAVFEEDPALKEALFARMRDMGIEPERYVVGNELNSINPVTGQPEFFLKKLFKGVKKAVKGVVKVFKKIAPIVLSIGLAMTPLGPIAGAALGSGIGTLVQGGSLKDAFKSALIGGAVGGLSSGVGSVLKGGEFMAGVKAGLPTAFGGGVNPTLPTTSDLTSKLTKTVPDYVAPELPASELISTAPPNVDPFVPAGPGAAGTQASRAAQLAKQNVTPEMLAQLDAPTLSTAPANLDPFAPGTPTLDPVQELADAMQTGTEISSVTASAAQESANRTFFDRMSDLLFRGGSTREAIKAAELAARNDAVAEYLKAFNITDISMAPESLAKAALAAGDAAAKAAGPGLMARFGPSIGLLIGGTALAGGFEPGPQPEPFDFFAGMDRTPYQFAFPGSQFKAAAGGGEMTNFPRKNGAIRGPGTEPSDDIPAMLSDGEFVMTARAVRGAGNGSRQDGMKRMYDMMRTFEGRASRG